MGNRTEYLLATMKTPQYDIGAFSNASNQLVNALNAGANQIGDYNKQQSQAYANQYVNDLLGKTNEANYTNNIAKLRGMGAYTSPEMQKQIEGIASDIKDQRSYNLQKEQAKLAQAKFDYDKSQQDKKDLEEFNAKVGALGGAQADILGSEYANGKITHPLLAKGIAGIDTGAVAAAKEGLLNLSPEDRVTAMQELNNRINEAYGEYANYNRQRDVAVNQASTAQSLLSSHNESAASRAQSERLSNKPEYDTYTNEKGQLVQYDKRNPLKQTIIGGTKIKHDYKTIVLGKEVDPKTGSSRNILARQDENGNITPMPNSAQDKGESGYGADVTRLLNK